MSARLAAGILLYRRRGAGFEVPVAHPGGPLWATKDLGAWTIPKGEPAGEDDALACARREFEEQTGLALAEPFQDLGEIRQKGGERVRAWVCEGDADPAALASNTFTVAPRSGRTASLPEMDRFAWFPPAEARRRINPARRS